MLGEQSPNIEFYRVVLGIDSDAPGFGKVRIAPNLGTLKKVSGTVPHPLGDIAVNYEVDKKGKLIATVDLPENIKGLLYGKVRIIRLCLGIRLLLLISRLQQDNVNIM